MPEQIPYSRLNPEELKDLEAEFGRTLTPELAQWLIRYRMNRTALGLMTGTETVPAPTAESPLPRVGILGREATRTAAPTRHAAKSKTTGRRTRRPRRPRGRRPERSIHPRLSNGVNR